MQVNILFILGKMMLDFLMFFGHQRAANGPIFVKN